MAKRDDVYSGTETDGGIAGADDSVITGASIDPAALGGTPAGDGDGFDPAIHIGRDKRNADGTYRRKRGRKSGGNSGQKASSADIKSAVEMLSATLVMVHTGIAASTHTPELAIGKDEGDLLAKAAVNVMDQFDVRPDPKVQAVIGMIIAAGTVYGPRAMAIKMRHAQEADAKRRDRANAFGGGITIEQ